LNGGAREIISFKHAWFLLLALARHDEVDIASPC
jgi:hypothetical protein